MDPLRHQHQLLIVSILFGSPNWARTSDIMINSHALYRVGISLFSHPVARALFSAPQSLTSVFGMGTGGPSASSTPTFSRSASFSLNLLLFSVQTEILFKSSETYVKQTLLMNNIYPLFFEHSYKRDFGDSCGNRTRVAGVRGRSLNRLTNEPFLINKGLIGI